MIEVVATDEFRDWYDGLSDDDADAVSGVVGLLERHGVRLGFPYSSDIRGAAKLRELRVQSHGAPLRIFYAFDPRRQAVLLIGGDKTGEERRFYERLVPIATRIFAEYLAEQEQGLHDTKEQ